MATIFGRLTTFSTLHKLPLPTQQQRSELGTLVFKKYLECKPPLEIMHYKKGIDEEGNPYKVRDYPNYFIPVIDQFIQDFYAQLPKPKQRKRIAIPRQPIFSAKYL